MDALHRRAAAMAPDERRRAIVEAVKPLLIEHGPAVTTRQMAEAAGIAEGTIFRVFPDKTALIHEVIRLSMDPAPLIRELECIDPNLTLEEQLRLATRALLERLEAMIAVMTVLRGMSPAPGRAGGSPPAFVAEAHTATLSALTGLFERHRRVLLVEPSRAAVLVQGLIFATAHPGITRADRLTVDEIVGVLLSGIVRRKEMAGCSSV